MHVSRNAPQFKHYPESKVIENNKNCWFCLGDPVSGKPRVWLIHPGGEGHPIHAKCAMKVHILKGMLDDCSFCKSQVDRLSVNNHIPLRWHDGMRIKKHTEAITEVAAAAVTGLGAFYTYVGGREVVIVVVKQMILPANPLLLGVGIGAYCAEEAMPENIALRFTLGSFLIMHLAVKSASVAKQLIFEGTSPALIQNATEIMVGVIAQTVLVGIGMKIGTQTLAKDAVFSGLVAGALSGIFVGSMLSGEIIKGAFLGCVFGAFAGVGLGTAVGILTNKSLKFIAKKLTTF